MLLANAAIFIEDTQSNELARRLQIQNDLTVAKARLGSKFPKFKTLDTKIGKDVFSVDLSQLILDILRFADLPLLQMAHESPATFVQNAKQALLSANDASLTWIELALMVEWDHQLQMTLKEKNLSKHVLDHLENFAARNRYTFDFIAVTNAFEAYLAQPETASVEDYVVRN